MGEAGCWYDHRCWDLDSPTHPSIMHHLFVLTATFVYVFLLRYQETGGRILNREQVEAEKQKLIEVIRHISA
jgi:hypothetical protein